MKIKRNIVFTILLQLMMIINNLVVPRCILSYFGSSANGLLTSILQFLNYISIIEGGISSVVLAELYKPLVSGDTSHISGIVVAAERFFRKIGFIFCIYMVCVGIFYPIFVHTDYPKIYVFALTMSIGIALLIQYLFAATWRILLQADAKSYISSAISIVVIGVNTVLTVLAVHIYADILVVKIISALAYFIQPVAYGIYIRKKYEIDRKASPDYSSMKHRWEGFGINLASFLNSNTDVIVLTVLSTLSSISVYSVYSLVVVGLKQIITSISAGFIPVLGREFALKDNVKLSKTLGQYELLIQYATFSAYGCAACLIVPFVKLYTIGVNDANYIQRVFSILLILSYTMFCLREPYVNMAYAAARFKDTQKHAYIEATINVVFSIFFVKRYGLNGVAVGTLCSMTYRTIYHLVYLKFHIIRRNVRDALRGFLSMAFVTGISIFLVNYFLLGSSIDNWRKWIFKGIISALIIFGFNLIPFSILWKINNRKG